MRDNGLTLVLAALFLASVLGMAFSGWLAQNRDLAIHGAPPLGLAAYLVSGDFASALFENWESEFLQMAAYVMLTAVLFQRGSAESRDPDAPDPEPRPARPPSLAGRIAALLRAYGLGLALAGLFVLTFALHLIGSSAAADARAAMHGQPSGNLAAHLGDAQFWFESFQNWQSEFLATATLVVLSIFLRFRGSPESKRLDSGNDETGR